MSAPLIRPFVLGLSGPSAAGKSSLALWAQATYPEVSIIKQDDFYMDRDKFPTRNGFVDWESEGNFYWDELVYSLARLRQNKSVKVPVYSKRVGKRVGYRAVEPSRLIIVEGFLIIGCARVRRLLDRSIYLSVTPEAQWTRRRERDPDILKDYFDRVMIPFYRRYAVAFDRIADLTIDANGTRQATRSVLSADLERIIYPNK